MHDTSSDRNASIQFMELTTAAQHAQLLCSEVGQFMKQIASIVDGSPSIRELADGTTESSLNSLEIELLQMRLASVGSSLIGLMDALQRPSLGYLSRPSLSTLTTELSNLRIGTGPSTQKQDIPPVLGTSADSSSKPTTASTSNFGLESMERQQPRRSRRRSK